MAKRLLAALGIVLLLFVAVLIVVPLVVDPNDYKDRIAAMAQDATGRELRIVDDMELSLFPWLGVEFGEVVLANARGFGPEPFARIDGARIKVKLLPLLRREIVVDTVVLQGLRLSLAVDENGRGNWEDLTAASGQDRPAAAQAPAGDGDSSGGAAAALPAALVIGGLDIRDAAVSWHDAAAGTGLRVSDLSLRSSRIAPGTPVDMSLSFDLDSTAPALKGHAELTARVTAEPQARRYRIEGLELGTDIAGEPVPGGRLATDIGADIDADLGAQTVTVARLSVATLGMEAGGALQVHDLDKAPQVTGRLQTDEFDPRQLIKGLGQPVPETSDPGALRRASVALEFEGSAEQAALSQLTVELDETALAGTVSVRDFGRPAVTFDAGIDRIDVDRYLPAAKPSAAAAPAAAPAAAAGLPLETLRALRLDGELDIGMLKAGGLTLRNFMIALEARDGLLSAAPLEAKLYGGRLSGDIRLDARGDTPLIKVDESLSGVEAQPLLKDLLDNDRISGTTDMEVNLTARGVTTEAVLRSLEGRARFAFRDGAVKGLNIAQMIRDARARLEGRPAPDADAPQRTDFTALKGTVDFANGVARNDDLRAASPYLRIAGEGNAQLIEQQLDYRLRVKVVDTATGQGGEGLEALEGVEIPIKITGAFTAPTIKLDSAFIREALKQKAGAEVRKKVEQQKKETEQRIEKEVREKEEELEQRLKDKLKGLF